MTTLDWTAVLAVATTLLAVATTWMAAESRKARLDAARRDRELAFRAALVELTTNIQQVETWTPSLESTPPENWHPLLSFTAMRDLLARVWIPGALWDRIMALMTNLQAYIEVITAQIRVLPPDASSRGEYTPQRENIRDLYYFIDLYLKQLACYLVAEMRRQRLSIPKEWKEGRPLFAPLIWRYDVGFASVPDAVYSIESGHVWPPFTPQAPEPADPAYRSCTLERLIETARQKSLDAVAELRAAVAPERIEGD